MNFVVWYIICKPWFISAALRICIIPGHQEFCFLGQTAKQINHLTLPDKLGDFEGGTEEPSGTGSHGRDTTKRRSCNGFVKGRSRYAPGCIKVPVMRCDIVNYRFLIIMDKIHGFGVLV